MTFDRTSERYNPVGAARRAISTMLQITMGDGEKEVPRYFEANDPDVPTISDYEMPCFVVFGPEMSFDLSRRLSPHDEIVVKDIPNLDAQVFKADEPWLFTFEIETHTSDPENDEALALFMMRKARDVRSLDLIHNKDETDELLLTYDVIWHSDSGRVVAATGMIRRRWALDIMIWLLAGAEAMETKKLIEKVEFELDAL